MVSIELLTIADCWAGVTGIANSVVVCVLLVRIVHGGTVIAGIADPISILILLERVGNCGTVVEIISYPIIIGVFKVSWFPFIRTNIPIRTPFAIANIIPC
jgi:hypothetical protein